MGSVYQTMVKLNISYPAMGTQKLVEIHDENKWKPFFNHRMSQEVDGSCLGEEFKGYIFRICGGNDKQGFPMKQRVLTTGRVRLLLSKEHSCYRSRRAGERKRKSVHGCIVDGSLSVLNLAVVKKGESEIPGLTDKCVPKRLGPKRASNIRKLFNLSSTDDVRKYVVHGDKNVKDGKTRSVAPKIQRPITPGVIQRKRYGPHRRRSAWRRPRTRSRNTRNSSPPGTRNKKQPALRPTRREGCPHPREVNPSHPLLNYIVHIEK